MYRTYKKKAIAFKKQIEQNTRKEFMTPLDIDTLATLDLHFFTDQAGYALDEYGEIINFFNNSNSRGLGKKMLKQAVQHGGNLIFCFDGYMRKLAENEGFVEISRSAWDDRFAPKGWNYNVYGCPDAVWLEYNQKGRK